jgi:hypothetical protein
VSEVLQRLRTVVEEGDVVATLSNGKPNWVTGIGDDGVYLETETSKQKGSGPQLVPIWMLDVAWERLRQDGRLANTTLLHELNVKRSSAVCALLSRLPEVEVASPRPILLRFRT